MGFGLTRSRTMFVVVAGGTVYIVPAHDSRVCVEGPFKRMMGVVTTARDMMCLIRWRLPDKHTRAPLKPATNYRHFCPRNFPCFLLETVPLEFFRSLWAFPPLAEL